MIAANTSLNRLGLEQRRLPQTGRTLAEEAGGLSGAPCVTGPRVIRRLRASAGLVPLIGVGGIDSAQVAWERSAGLPGAALRMIFRGRIWCRAFWRDCCCNWIVMASATLRRGLQRFALAGLNPLKSSQCLSH